MALLMMKMNKVRGSFLSPFLEVVNDINKSLAEETAEEKNFCRFSPWPRILQ